MRHTQVSLAYIHAGSVASHKVKDSEAHPQNLTPTGYIFTIIGYRTQLWPSFWPLKSQSNESTPSRTPFRRPRPTCWQGLLHPTRSKIPRPHLAYCISESRQPNSKPHCNPLYPKATRVHLEGHWQASIAYILTGSDASRKVENSEATSSNSVSHRLYYRHYLASGPCCEPPSDPLITQSNGGTPSRSHTGLGLIQASQAYMLTGPVASHKVEDSEAASPNVASHWLYFHHYWLQDPTLTPLSCPLKPKATATHLVGPIQASQAHMLTGPIAFHKGEDSQTFSPSYCISESRHPNVEAYSDPLKPKPGRVHLVGHRLASLAYKRTGSIAPNSVSHRLDFRHYLETGPDLEPPPDPLQLKTTGVYLIDHIQVSETYMLTGPVASHKVEDSEAHTPTLSPTGYIFTIIGYKTKLWPPFWHLKSQSNESTPRRPHSGVPGLHADRARCIPQGRRFRGHISHTASLSLGTPTSSPIVTPYNSTQRGYQVDHWQASFAYILTGSVASRKVENSEAASPNPVSHRLYYRHYLATGPNCELPSDPL